MTPESVQNVLALVLGFAVLAGAWVRMAIPLPEFESRPIMPWRPAQPRFLAFTIC